MDATSPGRTFEDAVMFAAGRLGLDFVNTACERRGEPLEFLGDVAALDRWLQTAERIHGRRIAGEPWRAADGTRSLARALALREALAEFVLAVLETRSPADFAVQEVNAVMRETPTYPQMTFDAGDYEYALHATRGADAWLGEIARDAADLLVHGDRSLIRQCECESCVRVFYDTTKNHSRRWCVEKCGSRVKAANYYRRKRARLARNG
jgi:predicted RNA-binding Zn ribbon-like protein